MTRAKSKAPGSNRRGRTYRWVTVGSLVAALCVFVVSEATADISVGGTAPSYLGLGVTQPSGLGVFRASATPRSYTSSFVTAVTSTEATAELSVVDEGRYGHMASGSAFLALPLEVGVSGTRYVSLAAPNGVVLKRWTTPIAGKGTSVKLLQRVTRAPTVSGPYSTVLLVTAATGAP